MITVHKIVSVQTLNDVNRHDRIKNETKKRNNLCFPLPTDKHNSLMREQCISDIELKEIYKIRNYLKNNFFFFFEKRIQKDSHHKK